MARPLFGLSLMLEDDWREAALPLLEAGDVDVLEWSFDALPSARPPWANALLDAFADADRLIGHGVSYSLLSGRWEPRQDAYLERLRRELGARRHRHFSEHLGCSTAAPFVQGTPLPQPWCDAALRVGRDRLARLARVARVPVGVENLALVGSRDDALAQCAFLGDLIGDEGFLLLDLHNLDTQRCNTGLSPEELLDALPLERAREIHVSGGSWATAAGRSWRRDTHDAGVPESVLALLPRALARCPAVEAVIFERIGGTLGSEAEVARFREDAARVRAIVAAHELAPAVARARPVRDVGALSPGDEHLLGEFQSSWFRWLHSGGGAFEGPFADHVRAFEPAALETARELMRTWGVRGAD